jgi:hypothetical protein
MAALDSRGLDPAMTAGEPAILYPPAKALSFDVMLPSLWIARIPLSHPALDAAHFAK